MTTPLPDPRALLRGPVAVSYSALVLDQPSRQRLAALWAEQARNYGTGPWKLVADHVTLALGYLPPAQAAWKGTDRRVTANAIGVNPAGTAVAVRVTGLSRTDGATPHVTLALSGPGEAEESNDIHTWQPLESPVSLSGSVAEIAAPDQGPDPSEGVTRLVLLDFDGTLIDTPEEEAGKAAWSARYGQPYPYPGWWGRPESLDPAIWPMSRVVQGYQAYRRERHDPHARLVLLTNRVDKVRPQVEALLQKHGLRLDALTFRHGGESKADRVAHWLDALPTVTSVLVLDDHDHYLAPIRALAGRYPHVHIETRLVDRHFRPPGALQEALDRFRDLLPD